ncbi:hypothetical protein Bca52824_087335 [Brassica carinata]|uniref:Uncharacterized protein n=1 Tax=Brassica carinata TaxID=52824 RepID=A0A8X7PBS8_BRACI|nr:hypothetical protein Bca52824_087335 [Brassica carinata]
MASRSIDDVASRSLDSGFGIEESLQSDGRSSNTTGIIGKSLRISGSAINRLTLFRCHRDGMTEELPDLAPEFDRSRGMDEQDWNDVDPTPSGVTFMIPRSDQRPRNPPVGYCCVYESFFGEDSKLLFPIPRLITSYCFRKNIAISHLMNGGRFYSVQMGSGLNILTSPLVKSKRWQRSYSYVKADEAGFEDPLDVDRRVLWSRHIVGNPNTFGPWDAFRRDLPKTFVLRPQEWKDFDRKRIRRQRRPDWAPNILCEEPKGKRLKLPIMGTSSKVFGPSANLDGVSSAVVDVSIDRAPVPGVIEVDPGIEDSVNARPPKKKRKRTKSSVEVRADPPLDGDEREAARTPFELRDDDEMEENREEIRVGNSSDPPGERSSDFAAARKNVLVMEYETALRIKIKEADLETVKKKKLDKEMLEIARHKISQLEEEKIEELEKTRRAMDRMSQSHNRELLSERSCVAAAASRRFEKFWKYMVDRDEKEEKRLLHGTALGTLDTLSLLEKKGLSVPHQLKDLFTTNEAKFKKEAEEVVVESITERDLSLPPPLPRDDLLPRMNPSRSTFGTVNSASAVATRSSILPCDDSLPRVSPSGSTSAPLTRLLQWPLDPLSFAARVRLLLRIQLLPVNRRLLRLRVVRVLRIGFRDPYLGFHRKGT